MSIEQKKDYLRTGSTGTVRYALRGVVLGNIDRAVTIMTPNASVKDIRAIPAVPRASKAHNVGDVSLWLNGKHARDRRVAHARIKHALIKQWERRKRRRIH